MHMQRFHLLNLPLEDIARTESFLDDRSSFQWAIASRCTTTILGDRGFLGYSIPCPRAANWAAFLNYIDYWLTRLWGH